MCRDPCSSRAYRLPSVAAHWPASRVRSGRTVDQSHGRMQRPSARSGRSSAGEAKRVVASANLHPDPTLPRLRPWLVHPPELRTGLCNPRALRSRGRSVCCSARGGSLRFLPDNQRWGSAGRPTEHGPRRSDGGATVAVCREPQEPGLSEMSGVNAAEVGVNTCTLPFVFVRLNEPTPPRARHHRRSARIFCYHRGEPDGAHAASRGTRPPGSRSGGEAAWAARPR